MLLAYLDESYTPERYYIAALIVPGVSAQQLTSALDHIVEKVGLQHPPLDPDAELHAHQLVTAKGDWAPLRPMLRARIGTYQDAIEAIVGHGAKVIVRGLDIAAQHRRYAMPDHPHTVVLTHLIERVDDHARATGELTLMIADEIDRMDEHRRNLWFLQRNGTWGWRARPITNIVDTLHFATSKASRLLQAADLAVYLYRRRRTHTETDPRAERTWESLWRSLEPAIVHSHCWIP